MPFISPYYNKKTVAALLVLTLLGTDLGPGEHFAQASQSAPVPGGAVDLNNLELPAEFGSVESVTTFHSSPFGVVILQDAHAIPAAQKSLFELTRWFQRYQNADLVLLEGASGDLDPLLLKSFPDAERLETVLMSYLERGEISGAAAAAVMKDSTANFSGIEDRELYRASVNAYLEASRRAPGLEKQLAKIKEELRKETSAAGGTLAEAVKFLNGQLPFSEQLLFLNGLVTDRFRARYADRFSDVFLLLGSLKHDALSRDVLRSEVLALAEFYGQSALSDEARKEAVLWKQQFQTEVLSAEDYTLKIMDAVSRRGGEIKISEPLAAAAELKKRFDALSATGFARQWQDFQERVFADALGPQRELFEGWKLLLLLERWLRLELSPEDWETLQSWDAVTRDPRVTAAWNEKLASVRTSAGAENPWDRFYRLADQRDHVFSDFFQGLAGRGEPPRLVLLAAGGFHTEGLEKKLSAMGLSHARVLPSVEAIPDEVDYKNFMSGEISWKQHFRKRGGAVDVYEAFQQSAAARIADSLKEDPAHFTALFTLWREEVIRALAGENRLSQAADYTSFIDRARFARLPESQQKIFEQSWNNELSRFLKKMSLLRDQNRLNGESIAALPARSGVVQWPAVMGFVKGSRVPETWTEGKAESSAVDAAQYLSELESAPARSELRSEEGEDEPEDADERREILFENPLEMSWKVFWFAAPAVFALTLLGIRTQAAVQPGWAQSIVTAVMLTGLYVVGVGAMLLNMERNVLRQRMNEKMVPAPRFQSMPLDEDLTLTVIDVPELFRAAPGERLPVEKFVSTALHALELIPSQVVSISVGFQTIYERSYSVPEFSEIMAAAEAFDFGKRPGHLGPISLRLTVVHGPAARSELRSDTGLFDESAENPDSKSTPVLPAEVSLERFKSMRLDADFAGVPELERQTRISRLNEEVRNALNGLVYREGYQLVWNALDYMLIRLSDQRLVGNISVELISRGDGLAVAIGSDLVRDSGQGLVSDFRAFLAKALPRNIPLTSGIDNEPTLLELLDLLNRDGAGVLSSEELSEARKVREDYSKAVQKDFYLPASGVWRPRARALLAKSYQAYPELVPSPQVLRFTQLGRLNHHYGNAETKISLTGGVLGFEASRTKADSPRIDPANLSVRSGLADFQARMEQLLDSKPFNAEAKPEAPDSYSAFVRAFASESGIRVDSQRYLPMGMFYKAQWGNFVSTGKSFFKDLFRGRILSLPGHLFLFSVAALNILIIATGVPSIIVDDEQGELKQLIFVNKMHFYFPGIALSAAVYDTSLFLRSGNLTLPIFIAVLISSMLFYFAAASGAGLFNLFSRGFSGHEMTHVFQFSLMERIRTELDLPVSFMTVYKDYFTHADLEAPPMPSITRSPPAAEQLKQQVRMITEKFRQRAAELEVLRSSAAEKQERWESEKRTNAQDTYHKHQHLLNDVLTALNRDILKRIVLVDAAGRKTFLDEGTTPELAVVFNREVLRMRREGGYTYRWSWGHQRLTVRANAAAADGTNARSELRTSEEERELHLAALARQAAADELDEQEILVRLLELDAAARQGSEPLDGMNVYGAFIPAQIREGPMVDDLSNAQMSDGPETTASLIRLIDRIGWVQAREGDLQRTLFNVVVWGFIHPDEKVRYASLRALRAFPEPLRTETLPYLKEIALRDGVSALILMGLIPLLEEAGELETLRDILRHPSNLQASRSAVRAIGRLSANKEALDQLIALVFDASADPRLVETALNTLANHASFELASMILGAFILGDYGELTAQAEKAFAKNLAYRIDVELNFTETEAGDDGRSELRAFSDDAEIMDEEGLDAGPQRVRLRNGVHQALLNRAVSLLVRARRDQHTPGADRALLEDAESKIQIALRLMKRIRGRAVLPAYLQRRTILERNLGNLLASNFIRRSILLRDTGDVSGARVLIAKAFEQLEFIEKAGQSDRVTRWTRSQAFRQSGAVDARAARVQRGAGRYEAALELYQKAWHAYVSALALLEAGDAADRQRTESERDLLNRELEGIVENRDEVRASLRGLIRDSSVELRLMGSDFSADEPYFLAGLKEPYPVLGRGEKTQLFSDWAFFDRYAQEDGSIRWDNENDVLIAYLGGQPGAAWAFQADLADLSVQGNGLYVSPVLRGSGLAVFLARRLFQMLKNQGFKIFQIGPSEADPSWGIERTPEAQAFHRSLIRRLGKNAVPKIVYYSDGQIQGVTVDLRRVQFSARSELRVTEETVSGRDLWSVFWNDAAHQTSFLEGNLKHSYYQGEMISVFDSVVDELSGGSRVIDIASGNGAAALALDQAARAAGKPLRIVSIDQADAAPLPEGRGPVEFARMKAEQLSFSDHFFDSAISFFGFEFTDQARALPELRRVLKPGAGTVFVLHAAESSLITFYREYGSLYDEFAPELLEAARLYAGSPEGEGGMAWFNAMSKALEELNKRDPKPGPMKAMVGMMMELEHLLSLDEGASENPEVRLKLFEDWERRSINVRSVMAESVRAAMNFEQARQLVRDFEKLGFDDVYVQPFFFQARHLGWIFHAKNSQPAESESLAPGVLENDRDKMPPGYVLHEIGNLLAGLLFSDILLDPQEKGILGSFYGTEFAAEYKDLIRRFFSLRSSAHVIKLVRMEGFLREMSVFFSEEKIAPVIENILASAHPSARQAAENFENSSRWIHQLLDVFLSGGNEPLQNIRVHGLINDAVGGYGDSVYYAGSIPDMNLRVDTYAVELYRAIRNLTINAVHATDEKVTGRPRQVELNVEPVDPDLHDGFSVRIQVRDNGTGIPADILPKIFEPYFSTKGDKGTGVGLSMVKKSVETTLGGKLTVETKEGEGTVFSIYLPASAPARSELRQEQPGELTRREALRVFGGAFLSAPMASAFQRARAQPKAKDVPRKLVLPQNAYLKNPLFREVYRDTQSSLLQLRTQAGLPFNQALAAAVPGGGWMKSSDLGFLWTSDLIAALGHASVPLGERVTFSSPASVTDRIRRSLAVYKKLTDDYGLKIDGVNTGILPEVLVHERAGFRAETLEIPGLKGEKGIPYAAYDMALTHVRLKILAEVFKGGYVRGLEDKEIVKVAEELLDKADYRPFLDADGKIRTQVFQKAGRRDAILGPALIDNRHTEAREFFLIPELFARPGAKADRRKEGLKVLEKLKHEWIFAAGPGGEAVAIGKGDQNLTSWTEYEGLQFLDPAIVSPGIMKISSRNYYQAAAELASGLKHEFSVTAPGSGAKADIYEPFGLKKPDVLVAAGPFLALNSDLPEAAQNAEKFIRAAKRQRSYVAGWGLADAYDPRTGRAYHDKRIYMNQALIVEALGAPFLRYVVSRMPDFPQIRDEFKAFDQAHPAPANVKNVNVLKLFESTGFFTQVIEHPSNREFITPKGALRIWYRLDEKNAYSGFFGKMKAQDFTPFKTLRLTFSKDSVLPEQFKIEFKDDSPEKKLIGSVEVKGAKAGETLEVDISEIAAKSPKVTEFLLVFDKMAAGKNPVGLFDLDEVQLSVLPARPRSELRSAVLLDPETEVIERGFYKQLDEDNELLQLVDASTGMFRSGAAKAKAKVHSDGDWHAVTQVYLFDKAGKLLLQERSLTKDFSPGKLQVSAGGHVNTGETHVSAAIRETHEELDITLKQERLVLLTDPDGFPRESRQGELVNREWVTVYVYVLTDIEKAALNLNHDEISRGFFVTLPFFETLAEEHADLLSGSLRLLMNEKKDLYRRMAELAAPGSVRSELRAIALPDPVIAEVLRSVALGQPLGLESADSVARAARNSFDETLLLLREAGEDDSYPGLMAAESGVSAKGEDPVLKSVKTPLTSEAEIFTGQLLAAFEADITEVLADAPEKKMTFAFGYRLPADEKRRGLVLQYLQTLARLRAAFPSQVTADIRLLVLPHETLEENVRVFMQKAGKLGVAKPVEMTSGAVSAVMSGYLAEFGSALVYGLPDAGILDAYTLRAVLSDVEPGDEFPVVVLLSRLLAEDGKTLITAERLGKIAEFLPGILKMQGSALRITRFVLEIAARFEADRLIQKAA